MPPEPLLHLQWRHPLWNILVNGKRQRQKVVHLLFVVQIQLNDVHGNRRDGLPVPTYLEGSGAFRHLIAQGSGIAVNREQRAEVKEEAQNPRCNTDPQNRAASAIRHG